MTLRTSNIYRIFIHLHKEAPITPAYSTLAIFEGVYQPACTARNHCTCLKPLVPPWEGVNRTNNAPATLNHKESIT